MEPKESNSKHVILVVEDEPDLREILSYTFNMKGYEVYEARNAIEALDKIKRYKVDAIISDVRMPGGEGVQLITLLKQSFPYIPVMLLITSTSEITFKYIFELGIDSIIPKPFSAKMLIGEVEKIIQEYSGFGKVRRLTREPVLVNIDYKIPRIEQSHKSHVLNIGRGGFFIKMEEAFPKINETLDFNISFEIGPVRLLKGSGAVRWVRSTQSGDHSSGCGVEFINMDETMRINLVELLTFIKTQQYEAQT